MRAASRFNHARTAAGVVGLRHGCALNVFVSMMSAPARDTRDGSLDDIRTRQHEQRRRLPLSSCDGPRTDRRDSPLLELVALDHGAHRAVEHEDPLCKDVVELVVRHSSNRAKACVAAHDSVAPAIAGVAMIGSPRRSVRAVEYRARLDDEDVAVFARRVKASGRNQATR